MAPPNGKASDAARRSSTRRSIALSVGSIREDEDYDLSAIAVADGFRPVDSNSSHSSNSQSATNTFYTRSNSNTDTETDTDLSRSVPQPPPSLADISSKNHATLAERPSSISKPHRAHDSLTLRNDGSSNATAAHHSAAAIGVLTASPLMRVESPYRGPSNPSHPYQMYPQRTLSNATSSTSGPRGPAHPYALYTQNTVAVDENAEEHIPVGFNNLGSSYQRQLGPDGEEAGDLIGPMGHLEELPPYSRYPTAAFVRKDPLDAAAGLNTAGSSPHAIAGAGGIGIATRNPEFSATDEDLALSRSRPSVRSANSELSRHEINTAAREVTEKPAMGKWQRRAKKKMWGIVPYWAICLLLAGLVIMGVIMGAVIGTLLSRHKRPPHNGGYRYDYDPSRDITRLDKLPRDLPPLVTGFFMLPPLDASQAPKSCFKEPSQSQAWSCDIPFRFYQMDVEPIPHAKPTQNYELTITAVHPADARFIFGTQPPNVPNPMQLTLVNDTFNPSYGPAWWLNITYDKTVMVREENFALTRKRGYTFDDPSLAGFDPGQFKKKSMGAEPGDQPWNCTWPDTTLEIFIYPSQNSSLGQYTTTTTATNTLPTGTDGPTSNYPPPSATTDDTSAPTGTSTPLPPYPHVVKFLERRLSAGPDTVATCRQVKISDDGHHAEDVEDDDGNPIVVEIIENSSSLYEQMEDRRRYAVARSPAPLLAREAVELTDCGCLWMSTG